MIKKKCCSSRFEFVRSRKASEAVSCTIVLCTDTGMKQRRFQRQKPHHLSDPVAMSLTASTVSGLVGGGPDLLRQRGSTAHEKCAARNSSVVFIAKTNEINK
jgi:hypothetical protein